MHLLLWILALATIHASPDITPHEGATFQRQGYLIGGLSWAHITAPINISLMEEEVNNQRRIVEFFDFLQRRYHTLATK